MSATSAWTYLVVSSRATPRSLAWVAVWAAVMGTSVFLMRLASGAQPPADEWVKMVADLITGKDKDFRTVGLESVRTGDKNEAATLHFAALLPALSPEAQAGLLSALADRKDSAARPAVLALLAKEKDEVVRAAALRSLGSLGESADVPLLMKSLSAGESQRDAARVSLGQLLGADVSQGIVAELPNCKADVQCVLLELLADRGDRSTLPAMLKAAVGRDATVRTAAMRALAKLAEVEQVAGMVQGVLAAEAGQERDNAERAIVLVCQRISDPSLQAAPIIEAMRPLDAAQSAIVLPTLGRIGGPDALTIVNAWIHDANADKQQVGMRALCNWPYATVVPQLIELFATCEQADTRTMVLGALIRVAPLADERSNVERLELLKQTLAMCQRDEDRNRVIERARAIRTIETLRFLLPFTADPVTAEKACSSIVELAHYRDLREPNKAEFDRALDNVLAISKAPESIDRATRYKNGQTWERPKPKR